MQHVGRFILAFVALIGLALRMASDFAGWLYDRLTPPYRQRPNADR